MLFVCLPGEAGLRTYPKSMSRSRTQRKRGKRWATPVTPCLSWAGAVGKTLLLCRFRRLIRLLHGPGPWRAALPFSKGVWHNGFVPSFHCVSVKHICSMTLQVYPSCEPSTPFLFLLPLNLRSSRQPRAKENYTRLCARSFFFFLLLFAMAICHRVLSHLRHLD